MYVAAVAVVVRVNRVEGAVFSLNSSNTICPRPTVQQPCGSRMLSSKVHNQ